MLKIAFYIRFTFCKNLILLSLEKKNMKYFFLFLILMKSTFLFAQISFLSPDIICQGEPLLIQNNSSPNQDYYWSFCGRDVTQSPIVSTFEVDFLQRPVFMDIQKDGENYYGFVTGVDGELVRLDFGNSLNNNPIIKNLNSLDNLFFGMEGIQIINEDDRWWGFVIGGTGNERLLRLDFGSSLENIPTVTNLGNMATFDFPNDLKIIKEGNNWYGLTLNRWSGGSLSVFSFDDGLENPPTGLNIGNIGNLSAPTGFSIIQDEQELSIFIANENSASISRIDVEGIFNPFPVGTNLGNLGLLNSPRDVTVFEQCGDFYGYVLDTLSGRLIELDFGENIKNTPIANTLLQFDEWKFPHSFSSIFRENNTLYLFILDVNNNQITRLTFPGCTNSSIPFYEGFQPPPIIYDQAGTYLIQLFMNEGQPNQSSFCKEITVLPAPYLNIGNDTTICIGNDFSISSNSSETIWQESTISSSFDIFETGIYSAELKGELCNGYDSIFVEFIDCQNCLLFPNAFTPDGDGVNDFFQPIIDCEINFITFHLQIYNRWGQKVFQTDNPLESWDGYFNKKQATSDVYVWKSFFSYQTDAEIIQKSMIGDVSLIR